MHRTRIVKAILIGAGLVAMAIGGALLLVPHALYASYGVTLGGDASQLSEIRAQGGALLASGLLIASGAFISRLAFTSALLASILYLSYGTSRLIAMGLDGMPASGLVQATALEIVIGFLCLFAVLQLTAARPVTG
ncbi:DUF4345 domain-containing protein [Hoeflea poritis]|uniref:DUF4345 domain-containing protein n=1 Tax=Hoeflea poritis TaxID=2993659 RepID=A0ABT4VLP6_9HYPH|nr:DUF4345 domain-containing protein [Hoeflea poritis]MDA4845638.1 DUF4345 domain-containing protein [Hoeflea poritis]